MKYWIPFALLLLTACSGSQETAEETNIDPVQQPETARFYDPHSYASPDEARVKHLDLDLDVDFEEKELEGVATWTIEPSPDAEEIVFDTRDLSISKVTVDGEEAEWELGEEEELFGQPLTVQITPQTEKVAIHYTTSPKAAALQWLEPEQTSGNQPFLFTQSQAILARTWVPTQDGPGIRFTYDAEVTVPEELLPIMSASNPQERNETGTYNFRMEQPIPSYLLALAVGDIRFAPIGERTGVYAEPNVLEAAVYEFADMEKMLEASEKLYGPYRWDRYDLIVLPPSFPFGGMENPRLTFATPTILAGDRSLTSLIAHEMAHSWSGNLVTNANWNDFWLNEGFTVYFERRIMEELYGRDYSEMLALLGQQDLMETIEELGKENPDTRLKLDLEGRDPDEGLTDVAYEKGYFFLRMLEEELGRERFDQFLTDYFNEYAFEVMDTKRFLDILKNDLLEDESQYAEFQVEEWVYSPGLPSNFPTVESDRFEKVEEQIAEWKNGTPAEELSTDNWSSHEWLHFVRHLPEELSQEQMTALDEAFGFTETQNSEVKAAWLIHVIDNEYEPGYPALQAFLQKVGRRKFLKPIYSELVETPKGKKMALKIYQEARPAYHSVSTGTIDELLGWKQEEN